MTPSWAMEGEGVLGLEGSGGDQGFPVGLGCAWENPCKVGGPWSSGGVPGAGGATWELGESLEQGRVPVWIGGSLKAGGFPGAGEVPCGAWGGHQSWGVFLVKSEGSLELRGVPVGLGGPHA